MDHINDFISALVARGFKPNRASDIKADDRWNRIEVNGEKKKNLRYQLKIDGDFAIGRFIHSVEGVNHKFNSKTNKKLSPEERAAFEARRDVEKKEAEADRARRELEAKMRAQRVWKAARATAGDHPYAARKGITGAWGRIYKGALAIPLWNDNELWALQYIAASGEKRFSKDGRISGSYCALAMPDDDKSTIFICEGYATGESVRAALSFPVIVAFNAGNLEPVAVTMRKRYPEARIVIAADNDQWTFKHGRKPDDLDVKALPGDDPRWAAWRKAGDLVNPGVEKAQNAAVKIGAHVVSPDISAQDPEKRTDFNDIHNSDGLGAVRERLAAALVDRTQESSAVGFPEAMIQTPFDSHPDGGDFNFDDRDYSPEEFNAKLPTGDFGMKFKILGYNNGFYYYFPFAARQIVALSASAHSIQNLFQIADLNEWEHYFGGDKISPAKMAMVASNAMIQMSKTRGVFQEEARVRGCGAWIDEGRVILHCGDRLIVDGKQMSFDELESHYTYVAAARLIKPSNDELSNAESYKLRQICESVTWENKLSGSLLAGWLVIAPICSALSYRPHLYLTGEAESGKSTVEELIIKPVIGRIALCCDGGTTEAGIRDQMRYDGRPLIFDEAEGENNKMAMMSVIELARKASTGSTVIKFGQRPFKANFCACFSAINPPVNKTADESRISFLVIKKNVKPTAAQDYEDLIELIKETITPDFSNRMIARTLKHMDSLLANIEIFRKAARRTIGGARFSQQIGTMLAGLYLLSRTDVCTPEIAEEWLRQYDWLDYTTTNKDGDPLRLLQHIGTSLLRYTPTGSATIDVSVGELVEMVVRKGEERADKALRQHGIIAKYDGVTIANRSQNTAKLLRNTEWEMKWSRTLADLAGTLKKRNVYFLPTLTTDAVWLPIEYFLQNKYDEQDSEPQRDMSFEEEIKF